MIEPPQPGFTGVVWEAMEPDRMARELRTGPGSVPLAEAGAAWGRLAESFGAAVVEYELVMATLRGAWQSTTSRDVLEKVTGLRDWLIEAAGAAADHAAKAHAQAAAYEVARLAMPDGGELAALAEAKRMLEAMTAGLGAPIRAVAAETDADADVAKAAASRVMRAYEAATEPLAMPWEQREPPALVSPAALAAEQTAAAAPPVTAGAVPPAAPGVVRAGGYGLGAIPRAKTAYQAPVFVQSAETETLTHTAPAPQPVPAGGSAVPLVPGAVGAAAAAQEQEYESPSGATAVGDALGAELGIVAAPAVLGAPEPGAVPQDRGTTGSAP
ncbi:PPE family protein [Nocardia farcinica]|uniref:PPE domain-containing protein n=2 Tax=Nocardia farcinica TaxID=37329 RepID=Q5Z1M6_NOCFA|nr:PPE domain-containing protein [Nocardia farcinica]AXK89556.1 PPE domain-containing protein [Nocardia farcinica]MBF6232658.1 PPE domain-containing protein [Nocardia farcinica]MBF6251585.1 PPE domain-containing protein [Nocardia farcinica]CRY79059.1 PPE-repeat proteins [Nocardia farcinica]SIT00143.1 PPE family protein [Nocardia farcinica]